MRKTTLYGLTVLLLLVVGCSPGPTNTPSATGGSGQARPAMLHIEIPEDADIADIPRQMAVDYLRAEGYTVETLSLANTSLSLLALEKGNLDVAGITNAETWSAVKQGASIVTIMDLHRDTRLLVAAGEISQCADLHERRVGVSGMKSTATVLLMRYLERDCPGVEPEYLIIEGSHNRWAALLGGQLDATIVDLSDMIQFAGEGQGDLNALVVFSQQYPGLRTMGTVIRRDLANDFPETVKDIVRAMLLARRAIQDPEVLSAEMVKRLQMDPETARTAAETYLERDVWDVNGGYSLESVQDTIDFLVDTAALEPGLQVDDVADLSYLNTVLDEIGRQ